MSQIREIPLQDMHASNPNVGFVAIHTNGVHILPRQKLKVVHMVL